MSTFSSRYCHVLRMLAVSTALLFAVGCSEQTPSFQGSDISGTHLGQDLAMIDHNGHARTLADFHGKVSVVFFGFTQCPDVCPTALAQLAHAVELLDSDAQKVQVLMITVDPERDSPEILRNYVTAFHPDFIGLTGTADQLAGTARSFKAYYSKVADPAHDTYTMDHGSSFYILDKQGEARVLVSGDTQAQDIAADIRQLL